MTRFSYVQVPAYPVNDCIDMIKLADDLGFYACYSVDETYHKDMWLLFAATCPCGMSRHPSSRRRSRGRPPA